MKHVEIRLLAIQDWREQGRLRTAKVASAGNVADVLTKFLPRAALELACPALGLCSGLAAAAGAM